MLAAGGGKLYDQGCKILGLEATDTGGRTLGVSIKFRVTTVSKALLAVDDLNELGWDVEFPKKGVGTGAALKHDARGVRIHLVKKGRA